MKTSRFVLTEEYVGLRVDKILPQAFPEHTRNYFHTLLAQGLVKVNGKIVKASGKLKVGDKLDVSFPDLETLDLKAKDIPLDIVYEDKNILVINKQAGLVVHPGTHGSHQEDSLVNAILHHCKDSLGGINGTLRPGIVHRLDKDTSGLMVVAKNDMAQQTLIDQFSKKEVEKIYFALVCGHLEPAKGTIDAPIGRSMQDRKKMAVIEGKASRDALTKYEVIKYLGKYTFVKVYLLTGRTHQIRVHFAAIGFPLVGDITYGREKINHQFDQHYGLKRQFLHAGYLSFKVPGKKKEEFESTLPSDLQQVLDALERETKAND